MNLKITVRGVKELTESLRGAVQEGLRNGLEVAGVRGQALVRENIEQPPFGRPIIATGTLHSSITSELQAAPGLLGRMVIFAQPPGGNYAAYVEAGTLPHFPPPRALLLWIKKKFGIDEEKKALSIAFAIARTIARRGTLGRGMFVHAFQKLQGEIQGIFEAAVARAIQGTRRSK